MRRTAITVSAFSAISLLMAIVPALAQEAGASGSPAQAALRIAFLNFAQVMEGTDEAQNEIAKVRTFMEDKQRELELRNNELEQLKQQFAAQERTLNIQTRSEMQRTISDKQRILQRFQEDTQVEINEMRDALFARLSNKIQPIMGEYAQQQGLAAIFFLDQLQGYFNPSLDVTQDIIRIYNERYPPSAEGSTPQGSSP